MIKMIKKAFYLFCALHCTMQAMELDTPSEVESKIVKCDRNLSKAIKKSLKDLIKDQVSKKQGITENVVNYHIWQNSSHCYTRCREDIKEYFNISDNVKPYVLLCASYQHPDRNVLSCSVFDTTEQKWILPPQIIYLQKESNTFAFYSQGCSFSIEEKNPIFDAQCAVIDIHDSSIPAETCYGLAQALRKINIPVVFNVHKNLSQPEFNNDPNFLSELTALLEEKTKNLISYSILKQKEPVLEKQKDDQNIQSPSFITPTRIALDCLIMVIGIICWKKFYK
jgi:hypothetical protein